MLLYKVMLSKKDKTEVVYQSISPKIKLPSQEIFKEHVDTVLIINTCDSSSLTPEDTKLYLLQKTNKG
jgi:hypothetical protein